MQITRGFPRDAPDRPLSITEYPRPQSRRDSEADKERNGKETICRTPEVKKMLWGGEFWSDGYFVSSVGRFTSENVICEYIMNQGKEESYRQLYQNLPKGE